MGKSLLITRPEHDLATRYLSRWSEKIIDEANDRSVNVIDLQGKKACRNRVISTLEKRRPGLVILNGHGNENCVAGHNDEVVLRDNDKKAIYSKIIFARSCKSAHTLGENAISQGATTYLGYKEDFWFKYNTNKVSRPLEDKTSALFLEPSNHVAISLLKDHSAEDSNNRSKALFRKNIEKLLIEGPSSEDYDAIGYLYWDMIHQICLGNKNAIFGRPNN